MERHSLLARPSRFELRLKIANGVQRSMTATHAKLHERRLGYIATGALSRYNVVFVEVLEEFFVVRDACGRRRSSDSAKSSQNLTWDSYHVIFNHVIKIILNRFFDANVNFLTPLFSSKYSFLS